MNDSTSLLARAILGASRSAPIDLLPNEVRIVTEEDAYRVQDLVNAELGGTGGWKVARAPDGVFRCSAIPCSRILVGDGSTHYRVPSEARIEFEIGVRFRKTIDANNMPRQAADLAMLVDAVFPAIEIVSSRFSSELQSTQHLQLADHQNCLMVIADPRSSDLSLYADLNLTVEVGEQRRIVAVDHERREKMLQALLWLCEHAVRRGRPIVESDIVITGALLGAEPLRFDEDYVAHLDGRDAIARRFAHD